MKMKNRVDLLRLERGRSFLIYADGTRYFWLLVIVSVLSLMVGHFLPWGF